MLRNLTQGFTDKLDKLFKYQDKCFGPEFINYVMIPQVPGKVQLMEIREDGTPLNFHFDIDAIDINAEDLLEMF